MTEFETIPETLPDDSRDGWHVRDCEQALTQIAALGELLRVLPSEHTDWPWAPEPVSPCALRTIGHLIKRLADEASAALPPVEHCQP